jgi:hypothetical protein
MQQGVGCFIYYFSLLCSLVRLEQLVLKVEVVEGGRKWRRGGRSWKLEKTGTGDVKGTQLQNFAKYLYLLHGIWLVRYYFVERER